MRLAFLIFGFKDSVGPGGVGLGEVGQELRLPCVQCHSWTSDFGNWAAAGGGHDRARAAGVAEPVEAHQGRRRNGWGAAPLFDVPSLRRLHPSRGGLRSLDALAGESGTVDHGQRERVFG
jgi:hypothetical protein